MPALAGCGSACPVERLLRKPLHELPNLLRRPLRHALKQTVRAFQMDNPGCGRTLLDHARCRPWNQAIVFGHQAHSWNTNTPQSFANVAIGNRLEASPQGRARHIRKNLQM